MTRVEYAPVGFGSHHWHAFDHNGGRWFATVDEVDPVSHERLRHALTAAVVAREAGLDFVVAPMRDRAGEVVPSLDSGHAIALYPFVDGDTFEWGEFESVPERLAVLELVAELHAAPATVANHALADDFTVPGRAPLEEALAASPGAWTGGPFGEAARQVLAEHSDGIKSLVSRYDALVAVARSDRRPPVLTHGEPHRGNTIVTANGVRLIDWDTALVGRPERDLWMLVDAGGVVAERYEAITARPVDPRMIELFAARWDLADIASFTGLLRGPHDGTADAAKSFDCLRSILDRY